MFELLFAMTFGWWIFWFLFLAALIVVSESELFELGFVAIAIVIGVLWWKGDVSPVTYVASNWLTMIMYYLIYLSCGAAWSTIKWWFRTHSTKVKNEFKSNFNRWSGTKGTHEERLARYMKNEDHLMNVWRNKRKLVNWAMWWIPSLIWTVMHDFVKYVWETVYNLFLGVYNRISNHAVDSIDFDGKND